MSSEKACFIETEWAIGSLRLPPEEGPGDSLSAFASRVCDVKGEEGSPIISTFLNSSGLFCWQWDLWSVGGPHVSRKKSVSAAKPRSCASSWWILLHERWKMNLWCHLRFTLENEAGVLLTCSSCSASCGEGARGGRGAQSLVCLASPPFAGWAQPRSTQVGRLPANGRNDTLL